MNRIFILDAYLQGQKGRAVLKALVSQEGSYSKLRVIIGTDSKVKNDYSKEIEEECLLFDIQYVYFREGLKNKIQPGNRFAMAVGWQRIIQLDLYLNVIVFHDSILPKYRGFNPLVSALINGDREVGVTALIATDEYDEGPILGIETVPITYPIKIFEAIELVSFCYEKLTLRVLDVITSCDSYNIRQDDSQATYSLWRDEKDYYIDWTRSAAEIERMVNAVGYPYDGARCQDDVSEYILSDGIALPDVIIENRMPGKIIFFKSGNPVVVCGDGLLKITGIRDRFSKTPSFFKFRTRFL